MAQCPVCQREYVEGQVKFCITCGWDLSRYGLTFNIPDECAKKDESRIIWARQMWAKSQSEKSHQFAPQLSATLSELKEQLSEIKDQLLEAQQERSTIKSQLSKISAQIDCLPGQLKVYEFCRGFLNIHLCPKSNRWVSGGLGNLIGTSNHPVPKKIQLAVTQGEFKIDDYYAPTAKKVALIARDIDKYSVLAVVTGEIDDRYHSIFAYRYFWTEKNSEEVDGIGSLLLWWFAAGQPRFEMNSQPPVTPTLLGRLYTSNYLKELYQTIGNNLTRTNSTPHLFTNTKDGETSLSPINCHCMALQIQDNHNHPLSWAWNVPSLEHPEKFTVICCIDNNAYQHISETLGRHKNLPARNINNLK